MVSELVGSLKRLLCAIGPRRVIGALGALYVALAVGRAIFQFSRGGSIENILIVTFLIAAPGGILLYGVYWISRAEIDAEFYPDIAGWCLAGLGAMVGILLLYDLQPGEGISDLLTAPPILTALSSVAGFIVGLYDGLAKTRTRQLEQRNRELGETQRELEETVTRLEESNERLEQFAYAASHDLQEPLRMVSSYLKLIESRYEDQLDEDGREFLEFAVDGADRMRSMIEGLLNYSRVETRGESFEPVDLEAVLEDVREDLQVAIEDNDATITTDALPHVEGDPNQLRQLFQNLLENAIEYSGKEPPVVHVSARRNNTDWLISMRDEGIGIAPEDQDKIFEIFQRAHDRSHGNGTGIGLALCKRIIERHGGDIRIDSELDEGTTVQLTLPAANEQSA